MLLFSLSFQKQVVAVILSFPFRGVMFSYLSAFDPEFGALGFGKLLLYEAMKHTFESGFRSWNFLRGSEPYKLDWGAVTLPRKRVIVEHCPPA